MLKTSRYLWIPLVALLSPAVMCAEEMTTVKGTVTAAADSDRGDGYLFTRKPFTEFRPISGARITVTTNGDDSHVLEATTDKAGRWGPISVGPICWCECDYDTIQVTVHHPDYEEFVYDGPYDTEDMNSEKFMNIWLWPREPDAGVAPDAGVESEDGGTL